MEEADGLDGVVRAIAGDAVPLIDDLHARSGRDGRGTGARPLRAARGWLSTMGRPRAYLTVLESNPRARAFFLREGGTDEGRVADRLAGQPARARRIGSGPP